jgi:hypothetical protein
MTKQYWTFLLTNCGCIFADELWVHRQTTIFQFTKSSYVTIATRVIIRASFARYQIYVLLLKEEKGFVAPKVKRNKWESYLSEAISEYVGILLCLFRLFETNLDLCLELTAFSSEGSFKCHTYCDTGPPFLRSYPKGP